MYHVPLKRYVPPVPKNMILFENRVFIEAIKLKRGQKGRLWPYKEGTFGHRKTHVEGDDGKTQRGLSTSISQGMPKATKS